MLCREVELLNPFQHRDRTKERGKVWEQVAQNLGKHGLAVSKRIKGEKDADPSRKRRNTGSDVHEFLLKKLELEKEAREQDYKFRREEAERKRLDDERRLEREERQEERRREREEREERREEERRRQEEETKRSTSQRETDGVISTATDEKNQMIMLMLEKQKKE
ncbi:uncharacterized protein LOC135155822 [Lytechinus pictus]|uniref:uncharacterized protein LOC135155822 n=1 Tax=Lytechinus pictus TaxID=7653 RepID=UPI0030BA0FE4